MSDLTLDRWIRDRARDDPGAGRDRLPRRGDDLSRARRAVGVARRPPARRRARAGRPRGDAHRLESRARRRLLRVREGGPDPAPAELAADERRARLPARRCRAGDRSWPRPSSWRRPPRCTSGARRSRSLCAKNTSPRSHPTAAGRRRRAAARLHLGHDRTAEGRRCSRTRTASGRTSPSTVSPVSGTRTSSSSSCPSSTSAAGTCSRCSRGGRAPAWCSSRRSTRPGRSR